MRALSTALLAGLEGVGPLLLQHPAAVAAVLARLRVAAATAAAEQGAEAPAAKRARGGAPEPAMTPRAAAQQAAEEVEASWALCSALAHALASQPEAAEEQEAVEAAAGAADAAAALGVLAEHADVLCHDWAASGPSLGKHQAYVLARVARQLAPLLDEAGAARLQAAAVRGGTATEKTAQE